MAASSHVRLPQTSTSDGPAPGLGAGVPGTAVPERADSTLLGGWSATRWQYTDSSGTSVDVVCDLGGSVSLSLSAATFILAYGAAGRASSSVSGTFLVQGDELVLTPHGDGGRQSLRFRQLGQMLSLYSDASGWDFDGDGNDEQAEFVAVLVQL